jgi:hypothetical protein
MSLPKKKSRTVDVGKITYRYLIKTMRNVTTLIVQDDCDSPGNPLLINMDMIAINGGKNYGIGPGDVRKIVQKATEMGWVPSKKGPGYIPKDIIEITREDYTRAPVRAAVQNFCPCMMTPCPHVSVEPTAPHMDPRALR